MNSTAEEERLLRRDAEWAEAASEGREVERILSYWTEDAIVLPPGLPSVVGKAALRQYVEGSMQIPGFRITWKSEDVTFSPDGRLAYMFSRNAVTDERAGRYADYDRGARGHDLASGIRW